MAVTNQEQTSQSRKIMLWLLTLLLYLATVGMGFLAFIAFQDIFTTAVGFLMARNPDVGIVETRGWITTARNVSTIIGGLVWLAVMVGGMEYHFRHVGQRRSYRVFTWTLGIEVVLVIVSALFF